MFMSPFLPLSPTSPSAAAAPTAADGPSPAAGVAQMVEFWTLATKEAAALNAEYWESLSRCRSPMEAAEVFTQFTEKTARLAMETMYRAGSAMQTGAAAVQESAAASA